jgi:NTP pyrophosphatase (non-canonical NTP hydrolase)
MDLAAASDRALHVRSLYERMEERIHGSAWTPTELMVGFLQDVGDLGRLVMAAEGRWKHGGDDLPAALGHELAECLWWVLVLAKRLDVDIAEAFESTMARLDEQLSSRLAQPDTGGAGPAL